MTFTTGVMDAVSVFGLGHVFTANMTGNVVFLGFALAGTPGYAPWVYVAALTAFLGGAAIGGHLGRRFDARRSRWLLSVALIEAGLIFAAALAAWEYQSEPFVASGRAYLLIALTAIAMGMRNATVRRLGVADLTTTVLTMTLRGWVQIRALRAARVYAGNGAWPRLRPCWLAQRWGRCWWEMWDLSGRSC